MPQDKVRHCLVCNQRKAIYPSTNPCFCSAQCVIQAANDLAACASWCDVHQCWFTFPECCEGCQDEGDFNEFVDLEVFMQADPFLESVRNAGSHAN